MRNFLKKIKSSEFYGLFTKYFIRIFFNLFWEYILNLLGKFIYVFWKIFRNSNESYEINKKRL